MATPVLPAMAPGLTEHEQAARLDYLGGSESAAVLGLNPHHHGSDVYHAKVSGVAFEPNDMMMMGQALEPYIIQRAALELEVETTRANRRRVHPTAPMQATIDAFIVGRREFIEAKLTHPRAFKAIASNPQDRWGEDYTDVVPRYYLIQVQHSLHVLTASTGEPWDTAWLALMVGVEEFHLFQIHRSPELGAMIEQRATDFWNNHVIPQIPPVDEGPTIETLSRIPRAAHTVQENLDPTLIPAYQAASQDTKAAEGRKEEAKKAILRAIGTCDEGMDTAGRRVFYPLINSSKFDKKAAQVAYPDVIRQFTIPTSHRRISL
jgi:predicted phage-related endonuclease